MKMNTKIANVCLAALLVGGLSIGVNASDDVKVPQDLAIDMVDAQNIALQEVSGTLRGSELEEEDGVLVWEIEIQNANAELVEIEIDAQSGAILEIEVDDD